MRTSTLSSVSPSRVRRVVTVALAALVLAGAVPAAGSAQAQAQAPGTPNSVVAAADGGYAEDKTLTRDYYAGGEAQTDSREVSVKVDRTTDLQARERVRVSWTGAHPSGGRAANPFGENGMLQEYPVVILQCRGVDDPAAPAAQQVSPDTCWTSTWSQRTSRLPSSSAVWTKDKFADAADQDQVSGVDTLPADCGTLPASFSIHVTPYRARDGKAYSGCSATTMPPEAAIGAADPPNEVAAYTRLDGSGSADFEIRTETENESLGCSRKVACSLVVVPIMGISCTDRSAACNRTGAFAPGSNNFANEGVDLSVSPTLWWSASNWRNRFTVPLSFALPPSTCQLLGQGTPVPFFGSALLNQAALQWAPAYCLDKSRFNWQANSMPDDAAYSLMTSGEAVAAEVTGPRDQSSSDPVGFAPTAVTGFGIAFTIDKPQNAGQQRSLKLNARLLAKLLTESYPASTMGQAHPGLGKNPISMNLDPEFRRLNPGLDQEHFTEAASTLLSLSTSSDVILSMTKYIAADPDAMAFVDGKADPWGMTVNPSYKSLDLPVSTWPQLDTWVPNTPGQACLAKNPAPYLPKVAAPVSTLTQIATAMILSWPNVQTVCDTDPVTGLFKLGRIAPQGVGSRFMLGLVSLGDGQRYGLPLASLQAAPGRYVAPTSAGLSSAVGLATQGSPLGAFSLDQAEVRRSRSAYPGMLIVQTAARLSGMKAADAAHVSSFIDISTTEGQRAGRGNGQLPGGYLPMTGSGPTAKLLAAAKRASAAIKAQKGDPNAPGAGGGGSGGAGGAGRTGAPTADGAKVAKAPGSGAVTDRTALASRTTGTESPLSGLLLPGLLVLGLIGALASSFAKIAARTRGAAQ